MTEKKRGFLAGLWVLIGKLGGKLIPTLIKLAKGLKFGKFAAAGLTFGAYSMLFSWKFVVVLMGSIFLHECGHIWAMRRCGMSVKGIYFLPFMGAAAVSDEAFKSRGDEAYIALMGPIWGLGIAVLTYIGYLLTGVPLIAALAGWMAMVNLFNLLPINPLDGGRLLKSVAFSLSSWGGVAVMAGGLVLALILAVKAGLMLLWLMIIAGLLELLGEIREIRRQRSGRMMRREFVEPLATHFGVAPKVEAVVEALKAIPHYPYCTAQFIESDGDNGKRPYAADEIVEGLTRTDKPVMSASWATTAFVGYLALAGALLALMYAASHVPAAKVALDVFMN